MTHFIEPPRDVPGRRCRNCDGHDPDCSRCDGSGWIEDAHDPLRHVAERWAKKIDDKLNQKR